METTNHIRCFIAIPLPDFIISEIQRITESLRTNYFPGAKWIRDQNLHITLKFLGDVLEEEIPIIVDRIESISKRAEQYSLVLGKLGAFPKRQRPRVIWLGMEEIPEAHLNLATEIEKEMLEEGFPRDKKTGIPHITLARIKHRRPVKWPNVEFLVKLFDNSPVFCINKVVLFKSTLSPAGAVYSSIADFNL